MKFRVSGEDKKEILEVCEEICKIKDDSKEEIKASSIKQKATKRLINTASSITGGLNYDEAYNSIIISYKEEGDNVILDMPFYIPKMLRFIMQRKLTKSFQEIFDKSCKNKVKVKFMTWGDENLKG